MFSNPPFSQHQKPINNNNTETEEIHPSGIRDSKAVVQHSGRDAQQAPAHAGTERAACNR